MLAGAKNGNLQQLTFTLNISLDLDLVVRDILCGEAHDTNRYYYALIY